MNTEELQQAYGPKLCPCSCHKANHEARKPHPNTMAGRKS